MTARRRRHRVAKVVARRTLEFRGRNGSNRRVVVRLGLPRRASSRLNEDWVCPYDVVGMDRTLRRGARGVDTFQALGLALHIIQVELDVLARQAGGGEYYFLDAPHALIVEGCNLLLPDQHKQRNATPKAELATRRVVRRRRR